MEVIYSSAACIVGGPGGGKCWSSCQLNGKGTGWARLFLNAKALSTKMRPLWISALMQLAGIYHTTTDTPCCENKLHNGPTRNLDSQPN